MPNLLSALSLGGSLISGSKAASAAESGAQASAQAQLTMFRENADMMAPWRETGQAALSELAALYGLGGMTGAQEAGTTQPAGTAASTTDGRPLTTFDYLEELDRLNNKLAMANEPDSNLIPENVLREINTLKEQYRENAPIMDGPGNRTNALATGTSREDAQQAAMGRFFKSPDYNFRLTEGINALDKSAAARGKLFSGQQGKAITQYAGNLASGEYSNYVNRLAGLANIGQTSAQNTATIGQQAAFGAGNSLMQAGNARASGYMGMGNTLNNALNNYQRTNTLQGINSAYSPGTGFAPTQTNFLPTNNFTLGYMG